MKYILSRSELKLPFVSRIFCVIAAVTALTALQAQGKSASDAVSNGTKAAAKTHTGSPSHIVVDDGAKNSSFAAFRVQLLTAIKNHDKQLIEDILSPNIEYAIGGARGKKAFNDEWQQLSSTSAFWARMQKLLDHGAQFDEESGEFHAPAVSFEDSHSELPQCIAWTKAASIHKEAKEDSPSIQPVYDEQLTLLEPSEPAPLTAEWVKVRTNKGKVGYIAATDVYSAYDEFAVFKKQNQKWCLSWFGIAGL